MSARSQQSHPGRTGPSRRVILAAVMLMCAGLGACTAASPPSAAPAVESVPLPYDGVIDAGTYVSDAFTVPFEITVPDGWTIGEGWLLIKGSDESGSAFLNFLIPSFVPTDACEWSGTITMVEPSVEAFADALAAQTSTTTTATTEITMGDYGGVEFDIAVDGGVDVSACDVQHICIHSESLGHCTRYYQSVDRRETYRVLDLKDQRAVISVGEDEGASADLLAEAQAIFDSIEFLPGG